MDETYYNQLNSAADDETNPNDKSPGMPDFDSVSEAPSRLARGAGDPRFRGAGTLSRVELYLQVQRDKMEAAIRKYSE